MDTRQAETGSRFTQATPWDRQPALWVLTSLFATWCFWGLVARCFIRRKTWLVADACHVAACVLGAASWIAMYVALERGAGKWPSRLTPEEFHSAGTAVYASTIFLMLAKGVATSSHLLLLKHMLAMPSYVKLCGRTVWLCLATFVVVCLTVSLRCSPGRTLGTKDNASCHDGVARWTVATILAISQALLAAALPAFAFWNLQKPVHTRLNIISWFSLPPIIDIVPLCLTIWQYTASISSEESGTGLVGFLVCLHSSLCWSLLYPIIPALRPTAMSYATRGAALTPEGSAALGSRSHSGNGKAQGESKKNLEIDELPLRPFHSREGNHTSIGAIVVEDDQTESSHGPPSLRNAIQITQEYRVSEHIGST